MSAPISEILLQAALPGGVLIASLLGSAHCAGMCGGLAINFRENLGAYHFGRLISYATLGALAGLFGNALLGKAMGNATIGWIATSCFAISLVTLGFLRLRGKSMHVKLPRPLAQATSSLMTSAMKRRNSRFGVFTLGVLSAFLPCGWLYTFVLAGAATKSAMAGAITLSLFWLGTVPVLSATPLLFDRLIQRGAAKPGSLSRSKLSGALMVLLGLASIAMHAQPLAASAKAKSGSAGNLQPTQECPMHRHATP